MRIPKIILKKFLRKLLPKRRDNGPAKNASSTAASGCARSAGPAEEARDDGPAKSFPGPHKPDPSPGETTANEKQAELTPPHPAPSPPLEECPICHDPVGIANPEGVVESWAELHCGHRFGTNCLQVWLRDSVGLNHSAQPSCPVCRTVARHPACGHPIVVGGSLSLAARYYLQHQLPDQQQQQRARRRLERRAGHPQRPSTLLLMDLSRDSPDEVGRCRACVENATIEALQRKWEAEGQNAVAGPRSGSAILKGYLPSRKRPHGLQATVHSLGSDDVLPLRRDT
ncbi:hypothetical protein DL766_009031 [Monosporascus sp. MC13-8B]|nr:hypothetical protein DL763_010826 [Monosporascus cannonballus]RYP16820.1 hypothetical protein DL766_009031 [Monosporascus sp. MC13-8B]